MSTMVLIFPAQSLLHILKKKKEKKFMNFSQKYRGSVFFLVTLNLGGCPRGVMVKAMDCGIVVSEFVLQSCYYVHFRANTLGKGMNPLILPAMG